MKVTVIIPNYNGAAFMADCMEALRNQTVRDFAVIIVDNASKDGSADGLEGSIPNLSVIRLRENFGFSRAVNEGIRAAQTPYVILLNNDTKVYPDYIEQLLKAIERSPRIFSVSPKMIQMYHPGLLDDAGDLYMILGWGFQRGVGHPSAGHDRPCAVFSACAGAAIYRKQIFEEIGYFDELHFAYLEDIDVGYRAKIFGYRNEYCPWARVEHVGSGTSGSKYNDFKVRLAARNSVYLNYKNMPLFQLIINFPALAVGWAIKQRFFRRKGFGTAYRDGLREGFQTRKKCKKVGFQARHLLNYLKIEGELIGNTFIYAGEFLARKLKKYT